MTKMFDSLFLGIVSSYLRFVVSLSHFAGSFRYFVSSFLVSFRHFVASFRHCVVSFRCFTISFAFSFRRFWTALDWEEERLQYVSQLHEVVIDKLLRWRACR